MEPQIFAAADLSPCPVLPALVWADGVVPPTATVVEGMPEFLRAVVERAAREGEALWESGLRGRVRDMLRHGHFRPSGRSKPASEFLLQAAREGSFPVVNGPVDVNNAVSLESGLPASVFDQDRCGKRLALRRGLPGETYVFNAAGHAIDLRDLLVVCRLEDGRSVPCGNPVKDSMDTKVRPDTRSVLAVLYAPADEPVERLEVWARRYAGLLASHCGAAATGWRVGFAGTESP